MKTNNLLLPEYAIRVCNPKIGMVGFLVIDNTTLGLGKGGIRMTPGVTEAEVARLARTMTYKNALAGIPFGGAKAGIIWTGGSTKLKKQFIQSFVQMIKPFIPAQYVAGPDVNTGEREMGWIVESLKNRKVATGKPSLMGGLPHELGSTGFGVAKATQVASQLLGLDLRQTRVAIEGFGNVGSFAFKFLTEMGATIVAVSDSRATAYLATGLSYQTLLKLKKKGQSTGDYPQATKMERTAILGLPVDILILATVTDVIDEENKSEVKAKLIVEGSNIPMSEKIEEELFQRGILVVPDLIANAGGVISSYAEYQGYNPKKMFALVDTKITTTTTQVLRKALQQKINPRSLAMNIALKRLKR